MKPFEFPYNFDKNIIHLLYTFDPKGETIDCIYMPPYLHDYNTILRSAEQAALLDNMTWEEYKNHVDFINQKYKNKLQLLIQNPKLLMSKELIQKYLNLGFTKFCVGSIEQAKIIKEINSNIEVIGSISMQMNKEKILSNMNYGVYFDSFVLPFYFSRDFEAITKLPKTHNYILLVNAFCSIHCNGQGHWWYQYREDSKPFKCPGLMGTDEPMKWEDSALIRPMDLEFFDPYISVYKLQDRGWPTEMIFRDYIRYTSKHDLYPGINYNKSFYLKKEK